MTVNLRMPGQYADSESGLFYNWNRYYNPAIGRYISSDPIGLEGGMNTFNYANVSPLMYSDPRGEAVQVLVVGGVTYVLYAGATYTIDACQQNPQCKQAFDQAPQTGADFIKQCMGMILNPIGTLMNEAANDNNSDQTTGDVIQFPPKIKPQTPRDCWAELFECEQREKMSSAPDLGKCSDEFLECMKQ